MPKSTVSPLPVAQNDSDKTVSVFKKNHDKVRNLLFSYCEYPKLRLLEVETEESAVQQPRGMILNQLNVCMERILFCDSQIANVHRLQ